MTTPISSTNYNVELRDKDGNLKAYLTPFVSNVSWEWNRIGGCGSASLTLQKGYRDITFDARDDIQIRVKDLVNGGSKLVYRGYIANAVPTLQKNEQITIQVRGYFDLFKKLIVHDTGDKKTYTTTEVSEIVDDIAKTFISPSTPIKINYLSNNGFELWTAGDSSAPDDWTLAGASAAVAKESTIKKLGSYSAKVTRAGTDCYLYQDIHAVKGISYWSGKTVTFGCWVYATVANRAFLEVYDGANFTNSSFHTGDSTWQFLTVTHTISSSADKVRLLLYITDGNTSAYYDGAIFVEGSAIPDHYQGGLIDVGSFECDSIQFLTTVEDALNTLAELAGDAEYGVDENLFFFWKTESSEIRKKFIVGDNVEMLERKVDYDKLVNKAYLVGGTVSGSKYRRTAENTDSQSQYYLSEKIYNNGSIVTDTVADQYLGAKLSENAQPQLAIRAKIANTSLRLEDTLPIGLVVFYDVDYDRNMLNDSTGDIIGEAADGGSDITIGEAADGGDDIIVGGQYSAQIDRIQYEVSNTEGKFNLTIQFGDTVLETAAIIKRIDLALANLQQYD